MSILKLAVNKIMFLQLQQSMGMQIKLYNVELISDAFSSATLNSSINKVERLAVFFIFLGFPSSGHYSNQLL